MNIAVIAANGRTGRVFVEAALKRGHHVRAGVLGRVGLGEHANLTLINCDATNPTQVDELLEGADAVVSFIGHVRGSAPRVQTEAIKTILTVMAGMNLRRIVSLTGTGVRFPGDTVTPIDWTLNQAISLIDPARIADGREHVAVLQRSTADWTVLRVLKLGSGGLQPFVLTAHDPAQWLTARRTVAIAALDVLEKGSWVQAAPIIGPAKDELAST